MFIGGLLEADEIKCVPTTTLLIATVSTPETALPVLFSAINAPPPAPPQLPSSFLPASLSFLVFYSRHFQDSFRDTPCLEAYSRVCCKGFFSEEKDPIATRKVPKQLKCVMKNGQLFCQRDPQGPESLGKKGESGEVGGGGERKKQKWRNWKRRQLKASFCGHDCENRFRAKALFPFSVSLKGTEMAED